jgi:hypothetical protein
MAPGEGRLLAGAAAAETPSWMFRTRTTVDVGSWLRKRRIWACLMSRDLVLVASGKRPFTEVVPLRQLGESRYNHVTGELLLGPADGVRNVRLRMPPFEGYEVLWRIRNKEDYDA